MFSRKLSVEEKADRAFSNRYETDPNKKPPPTIRKAFIAGYLFGMSSLGDRSGEEITERVQLFVQGERLVKNEQFIVARSYFVAGYDNARAELMGVKS